MKEHLELTLTQLAEYLKSVKTRLETELGKAGDAPTTEMTDLKKQVQNLMTSEYPHLTSSAFVAPDVFPEEFIPVDRIIEDKKLGLTLMLEDFKSKIEPKLEEYLAAVKKENDRIAEEERLAAEAAARASARAAASARGSGKRPIAPAPPSETFDQRYWRLAQGITVPVPGYQLVEKCDSAPPNAIGCYGIAQHYIKITHRAAAMSDCMLRRVIAHESYHYYQWVNGHIILSNDTMGIVVNKDQLEAAAYAYDAAYGC